MTIRTLKKFGPEQLLTAPRRTPGFPSPDGRKFVFTQSLYSFDSHSKISEIVVFDFDTGEQKVVSTDVKASEPRWVGEGSQLVWLKEGENGNTSFIVADINSPGKTYTAGTVAGPVTNLKLYSIEPGMVAVAVAGKANTDGSLHNPKDTPKSYTTAKLYDATFVRHWDSYVTKERNSIFTAVLKRAPARVHGREGRYDLVGFTNALKGTGLECPIPPFGGTDHFDVGREGLVIVANDPDLNPATHTKCDAYWVPKKDLMDLSEPRPHKISVPGYEGAASSPVFASDGSFAFLKMQEDSYEADKNHIVHASVKQSISSEVPEFTTRIFESQDHILDIPQHEFWSLSPSALLWSPDMQYLYIHAEHHGAGCLFALEFGSETNSKSDSVYQLTDKNYILEAIPVPQTPYLLVTSNSLVDNSLFYLLSTNHHVQHWRKSAVPIQDTLKAITLGPPSSATPSIPTQFISSCSFSHTKFGLSPSQVSHLWWKGDKDHPVHALMMRPSTFDPNKKYPLAYLIHGGPQGAWNDQWSTRWNPALFAEQGYIVIAPNPTGSTGYGQPFTDAIKENWGGSPYIDLEKGITYIEGNLSFIDTSRMVALGASYGGYMMNWFQGHPLGRKFRALVCHDGVFSMMGQLASEEQYFPIHDMGGTIWDKPEYYRKWDPASPELLKEWSTPMLVIHNDLDYRLTVSEGLSAFNVLQNKGVESRFLTFSDEGHWVLNPENSLVWCLVVLNWCNKFVGLPVVKDSTGRTGDEFCRQGRRKEPSEK
ncbi:hypothetical protein LTR05_007431 [Lithohypha guttulata]|uniref:Dipeptidyl-peptidase V n=1 Tax=Lithohypha guttulata TaxID=1690604 RepID=A0AAN7Y945_9EURO|nr:hypothetical protein LTR05_007431 [Lithohypha guttulata]